MNFLVVCRDEPYGFESLLGDAEVRAVPTLERFKGRRLKATETCERAVVVISDALVASGWLGSAEWDGLCERFAAEDLKLLLVRIGLAPCRVPAAMELVDESDARLALRRFLADQPVQLPRPITVGPDADQAWVDVAAQVNLGGDPSTLIKGAELDASKPSAGVIVQDRFRLIVDQGPDALFSNWYAHDLVEGGAVHLRYAHPHEANRAKEVAAALPVWTSVEHPSVARLLAQGDQGGALWFASGVVGQPLSIIAESPFNGDRVLLAVLDVADALAAAHAQGVVHGAVDPRRIHVGRDGSTLLSDFGVAAITRGSRDGVVYSAPETLAPDAVPELANDIYGLGMVLLLGLHGEALPYWVLRDANRLVDQLSVPEELSATLRAALDWVPNQRPTSVDAIAHALLSDSGLAVRLADQALQLKRLDLVERIVSLLDQREQVPSEVSRLRMAMARVRAAEGDPAAAIETLSGLAASAAHPAEIWLEIAAIQQETDDTAGAIHSSEQALEHHENRRHAVSALRLLLDLDPDRFARWGRTLALYTDGNEKGEVSWRLGKVFHESGDDASALLWLDRAALAGHETEELNQLRKEIRAARGDWNDVVKMMVDRSAESDDPIAALEQAARVARRATSDPEPLNDIHASILELDPSHTASLQHLIRQATRDTASEEVLRLQKRLCSTDSATPGDHAAHARKLLVAGRWEDALAAADCALAMEPSHVVALRVAGRAAQDGGRFDVAANHRLKLLELQSTGATSAQADRLARLGDLSRFSGSMEGASSYYDQAITISPSHLGAWWGLYWVERESLETDDAIPAAPLRFGPHEALARLLADLLEPGSIENGLAMDSFGSALLEEGQLLWEQAAAVVDTLAYREAIGPQFFDRMLDAFPQRVSEIAAVQSLWSGSAHHNGIFPFGDTMRWADDGDDFSENMHRELLFCTGWPPESALMNPRLFDVLFHREEPLEERSKDTALDDDEDLLLESPEVPVLLIGSGAEQRQVEIETSVGLTPAVAPGLPGLLSVHRHGDQIYLSVEEGAFESEDGLANEVRLMGGDKLVWQGVPIEFYRVQDPSTLMAPVVPETTATLPEDHQPLPGTVHPVDMAVLDPDEPCLVWSSPQGDVGVQIDADQLLIVARNDGSLVFTTESHESYLAVIMNRNGSCYLEENLTHDSGFGGRLSARAMIPGETLHFGTQSVVYRAPGKGLPGLDMPEPSVGPRRPYLLLMDGSQKGRPIAISASPFRLGRGRGCELQIRTDGLLSRVHCMVEVRDKGHILRDAGSSNGTRLNGRAVSATSNLLQEGDRIEIGHTTLVFTRSVIEQEFEIVHDDPTEEHTVDQESVDTRAWSPDSVPTAAFDHDAPDVQRKVGIANRALAVLAVALDSIEGPGRTRAELQLLIDSNQKEFYGLFDGIELSSHAIPWDLVDDALADRPERRRIKALSAGLTALVDRTTDRVCELLPSDTVDGVLADIAAINHRRELQF